MALGLGFKEVHTLNKQNVSMVGGEGRESRVTKQPLKGMQQIPEKGKRRKACVAGSGKEGRVQKHPSHFLCFG